jgi:hypothetical protein
MAPTIAESYYRLVSMAPQSWGGIKSQAREGPGGIVLCDWFVSTCISRINVLEIYSDR